MFGDDWQWGYDYDDAAFFRMWLDKRRTNKFRKAGVPGCECEQGFTCRACIEWCAARNAEDQRREVEERSYIKPVRRYEEEDDDSHRTQASEQPAPARRKVDPP